jgi:hypothetical protein
MVVLIFNFSFAILSFVSQGGQFANHYWPGVYVVAISQASWALATRRHKLPSSVLRAEPFCEVFLWIL